MKKMNNKEREIAGIPLLCRMVAEVYSNHVDIYSQPGRTDSTKLGELDNTTLYQIYDRYMERQLGRSLCNFGCLFENRESTFYKILHRNFRCCNAKCRRKSFHARIAIQKVFPSLGYRLKKLMVQVKSTESVLSAGLLEKRVGCLAQSEGLEFVHRTFAEYLATELIAFIWNSAPSNRKLRKLRKIVVNFTFIHVLGIRAPLRYKLRRHLTALDHLVDPSVMNATDNFFVNGVSAYFFESFLPGTIISFTKGNKLEPQTRKITLHTLYCLPVFA